MTYMVALSTIFRGNQSPYTVNSPGIVHGQQFSILLVLFFLFSLTSLNGWILLSESEFVEVYKLLHI